MTHVIFAVSFGIIELLLLVLIIYHVFKLFLPYSESTGYKMLPKSKKIKVFFSFFSGMVVKNEFVERNSKGYKLLNALFFPFVVLLMEIIFAMIFGPYVFFRSSGVFNWFLYYILKNFLYLVAVLVIINGILRYNRFRKEISI
ncbi:hypothetical protein KY334_02985 [Candidatus Woesearchaeota archaeon]|nr:hypothetical protein [Candidatus Woesearchaeota archaeon]